MVLGGGLLSLCGRFEEETAFIGHTLVRGRDLEAVVQAGNAAAHREDQVAVAIHLGIDVIRQVIEVTDDEAFGDLHHNRMDFGSVLDITEGRFDLHHTHLAGSELVLGIVTVVHSDVYRHRIGNRVKLHIDGVLGLGRCHLGTKAIVVEFGRGGLDVDGEIDVGVLRHLH